MHARLGCWLLQIPVLVNMNARQVFIQGQLMCVCERQTERQTENRRILGSAPDGAKAVLGICGSQSALLTEPHQRAPLLAHSVQGELRQSHATRDGAQKQQSIRARGHLISPVAEPAQDPLSSATAGAKHLDGARRQAWARGHGPGSFFPRGHRARGVPSLGDSASTAAPGLTCWAE